ncbi:hypothetical protein V8E55_001137 [Tylopilus felleus]
MSSPTRASHSRAISGSSVFSQEVSEDMFAVCYYDISPHLKEHKRRIEEAAQRKVDEKMKELENANKKHAKLNLKTEADGLQRSYVTVGDVRQHSTSCQKCARELALNDMDIEVHQRPLPEDEMRSSIIVFEPAFPLSFDIWRSATFFLLVNLCSRRPRSKRYYLLSDSPGLERHFVDHPRARITLVTSSQPMPRRVSIPATEDQIHDTASTSFDKLSGILVADAFGEVNFKPFCAYLVQAGLYKNLQQYLDGTTHTLFKRCLGQLVRLRQGYINT